MVAVRQEASLMVSLAELRAIEDQRIAAERQALVDAEAARLAERAQAAQRARDLEAAQLAAAHEAALAIERQREQAEREARMHVEAAEAAERARHQAALDAQRLASELELRRQEVARKRPRWMIAVTLGAVLAAGALTWFAIDRMRASEQASAAQRIAETEKHHAIDEANRAVTQLAEIEGALAQMSTRVDKAIDDVIHADTAAKRAELKAHLDQLQAEQAALRHREQVARDKLEHDARTRPVTMSKACLDNAYSDECLGAPAPKPRHR